MARHRSEAAHARAAAALRDAAYLLDFVVHPIPFGITITNELDKNARGVVHFYPRNPQERTSLKASIRESGIGAEWETEKLIAPAETALYGAYLEISIEQREEI